ncbi:hypothetical protein C8J57DRAFT_731262 [Mycena rebaudengoi]|nr:hypothetical protein C8J57DRAFT_731262 [Mycena rebaudengoi]
MGRMNHAYASMHIAVVVEARNPRRALAQRIEDQVDDVEAGEAGLLGDEVGEVHVVHIAELFVERVRHSRAQSSSYPYLKGFGIRRSPPSSVSQQNAYDPQMHEPISVATRAASQPGTSPDTQTDSGRRNSWCRPPTPPGKTGVCFVWHTIVSGDTCGATETQFGVSMAQLLVWSP